VNPRQHAAAAAQQLHQAAQHTRTGEALLHTATGNAATKLRQALGAQHVRLRRAEREMEALYSALAVSE
jgi:hypothetical protein